MCFFIVFSPFGFSSIYFKANNVPQCVTHHETVYCLNLPYIVYETTSVFSHGMASPRILYPVPGPICVKTNQWGTIRHGIAWGRPVMDGNRERIPPSLAAGCASMF
jgi:hypothetical protein